MSERPEQLGFIEELKRRRVIRVALVYVAVSYVIAEAADLVFPRLQLPDWTVTLVIGLAIVGFPLALVLAWAFELTPEGVRPTPPPTPTDAAEHPWLTPLALALLVGLLGVGAILGWVIRPAGPSDAAPRPERVGAPGGSIAVLPFANLSANTDSTLHLSDGFHRELVMQLHRIGLDVRSRTSVMRFRNTEIPLPEIGAELGVDYVVEGSVTFSGGEALISADLIEIASDAPRWNDSYELRLGAEDIFDTQSAIAERIARELRAELTPEAVADLASRPTDDFEAWALTQRGVQLWQEARDSAGYAASLEAFQQAIAIDSTYVAPYVGVALAGETAAASGLFDPRATTPVTRAAGLRALELDPNAALDFGVGVRALLASSGLWFDWDFEGARRAVEELRAAGEDIGPLFWLLSATGDHEGAIAVQAARVEGMPESAFFRRHLASRLYDARRFADAAVEARRATRLASVPDAGALGLLGQALIRLEQPEEGLDALRRAVAARGGPEDRARLVWGLGQTGRDEEARGEFDALVADVGMDGLPHEAGFLAYLGVGDRSGAIDALSAAADARHYIVVLLGQDPDVDPLRSDPRFVALMDRVGIPPEARVSPLEGA